MDINLVLHAKDYIDSLANGINPFTKKEIKEDDIVNNVRISRCLFYVSEVLGEVIANGGVNKSLKPKKIDFNADVIDIEEVEISDIPITVTVIAKRINSVTPENMKHLKVTAITNWLVSINMLEIVAENNKNIKRVTPDGQNLGLAEEERFGQYGKYFVVTYNKNAQQFILDNLSSIINGGFN